MVRTLLPLSLVRLATEVWKRTRPYKSYKRVKKIGSIQHTCDNLLLPLFTNWKFWRKIKLISRIQRNKFIWKRNEWNKKKKEGKRGWSQTIIFFHFLAKQWFLKKNLLKPLFQKQWNFTDVFSFPSLHLSCLLRRKKNLAKHSLLQSVRLGLFVSEPGSDSSLKSCFHRLITYNTPRPCHSHPAPFPHDQCVSLYRLICLQICLGAAFSQS